MIDDEELVQGLGIRVEYVLLDFVSAYEGDFEKFALDYAPVLQEVDERIQLDRALRACIHYFIEHPDVLYMTPTSYGWGQPELKCET